MRRGQACPTGSEHLFPQRARSVFGLVDAAALQFRHDELGEIPIPARRHGVAEVEAVDIGLVDPGLQFVGDLGG